MADYEEDFEDFEELDHHESSGYLSMKENVNTINVTRELKPEKKKKRLPNSMPGSKTLSTPRRRGVSKSPNYSSPHDRIISAKLRTIASLQNQLSENKKEVEELRKENKILNRIQARQEKDLAKYESKEGDFPQILQHHTEEIRVWKSKVKRLQEQYECSKRQVEGAQFELERVKERNRKLEAMGRKKNLDERELLAARLEEMTAKVQDRDKQIVELEYASQLQAKALQRDLKQLQSKNRSLYLKVDQLDQDCQRLRRQLREKEKEIEVKNIYTQRMPRNIPKLLPKLPLTCDVSTTTHLSWPNTWDHLVFFDVNSTKPTPRAARKKTSGMKMKTPLPADKGFLSHQNTRDQPTSPSLAKEGTPLPHPTPPHAPSSAPHVPSPTPHASSHTPHVPSPTSHTPSLTPHTSPTPHTISPTPNIVSPTPHSAHISPSPQADRLGEGTSSLGTPTVGYAKHTTSPGSSDQTGKQETSHQPRPVLNKLTPVSISTQSPDPQISQIKGEQSEKNPHRMPSKDNKDSLPQPNLPDSLSKTTGNLSEQDSRKWLSRNKEKLSGQDPPKWLSRDKEKLSEHNPPKWPSKDNGERLSEQDTPKWLSRDKEKLSEQDPPKWLSRDNKEKLSENDPPKWLTKDNKERLSGKETPKWLSTDSNSHQRSEDQKALLLSKLQAIDDSSGDPVTDGSLAASKQVMLPPSSPYQVPSQPTTTLSHSSRSGGTHVAMDTPTGVTGIVEQSNGLAGVDLVRENPGLKSTSVASTVSTHSAHQWPNTVENMHHGRPAMATDNDPFGTRRSGDVVRTKKSSNTSLNKGRSDEALTNYKPKYGRRQKAPISKVDTSENIPSVRTTSENIPSAETTSGALIGHKSANLDLVTAGDTMSYPWENTVAMTHEQNGFHHSIQSQKATPLLPRRQANPLQTTLAAPQMPGALEDDIEELTLT